jgi:hypothetical protein
MKNLRRPTRATIGITNDNLPPHSYILRLQRSLISTRLERPWPLPSQTRARQHPEEARRGETKITFLQSSTRITLCNQTEYRPSSDRPLSPQKQPHP